VPAVGIDGQLTAVDLDRGGALVPPDDVGTAGWLAEGPAPGEVGPAVLAGHVNGGGRAGLFARLGEVAVDDEVLVTGGDGVVRRFRVIAVDRYPKSAFPASTAYRATPDAELRLITCGGPFDALRHSYTDNVVVSARLVG
jgi:sortase (surface protein transpeptidase)